MGKKIVLIFPFREADKQRVKNLEYIMQHYINSFRDSPHELVEIVTADDPHPTLFNRGRALHSGVLSSYHPSDVLIFADGDLWVPTSTLLESVTLACRDDVGYVVPFSSVGYVPEHQTVNVFGGALVNRTCYGMTFWSQPSTGGLNLITAEKYQSSGGFDPRFLGWGFEDSAFDAQVQTLVGPCKWLDTRAYHLYHISARAGASKEHMASHSLCDRYRAAMGNLVEMKSIIAEAPRKWHSIG